MLVWLVVWVGLLVAPPLVLATCSAWGDALGVFIAPMLALLRLAFNYASQLVWTVSDHVRHVWSAIL